MKIVAPLQANDLMEIENFHGRQAPGMVLGGIMVALATELLGSYNDPAAVVETGCYLPDAVQLFTPCTLGNGRLVVLDWGKMAVCLYDRKKRAGYRIWVDLKKTRAVSSIYNWQMRLAPGNDQNAEQLLSDILTAGRTILSWRAVPITKRFTVRRAGKMAVCQRCDEAYPLAQADRCPACLGETYFELPNNNQR